MARQLVGSRGPHLLSFFAQHLHRCLISPLYFMAEATYVVADKAKSIGLTVGGGNSSCALSGLSPFLSKPYGDYLFGLVPYEGAVSPSEIWVSISLFHLQTNSSRDCDISLKGKTIGFHGSLQVVPSRVVGGVVPGGALGVKIPTYDDVVGWVEHAQFSDPLEGPPCDFARFSAVVCRN